MIKVNKYLIENGAIWTLLGGLWTTVLISFFSIVVGTMLGFLLCILLVKAPAPVKTIVKIWVRLLKSIPVSLLLILMFYVIFSGTSLSALNIAIITYSLNMSAHATDIIYSSYSAIDKGQIEAARTLGFSSFETFKYVLFPQGFAMAKNVYQSVIINILQWTSVVSFITLTDITRVVNIFAARTLEPLFMIVIGMLLYLGLACVIYALFCIKRRKKHAKS